MSELAGFYCSSCGQYHEGIPVDFGADEPAQRFIGKPESRVPLLNLTSEWCTVGDEAFFVRGVLEIPVLDGPGPFVYGVWVSLSEKSFRRTQELWNVEGREKEPPYFGWLCTSIPGYPETIQLKTHVETRSIGLRPSIVLEPTNHPLAVEQRDGITTARVQQIVESLIHAP